MTNEDVLETTSTTFPTKEETIKLLVGELKTISPGQENAQNYHNLMISILELLFYPQLIHPIKELEINEGRKRIDIVFDNSSQKGFFYNLHKIKNITCPYVMIECKNYSQDPKNPELDQLNGRFSTNRGRFGLLLCRKIEDRVMFEKRCKDFVHDQNNFIIGFDDEDIIEMLTGLAINNNDIVDEYLETYYKKLVFNH